MTLVRVPGVRSSQGRFRAFWSAFSVTMAGDLVATAVAIAGISALFIASAFGAVYLWRLAEFLINLLGA